MSRSSKLDRSERERGANLGLFLLLFWLLEKERGNERGVCGGGGGGGVAKLKIRQGLRSLAVQSAQKQLGGSVSDWS